MNLTNAITNIELIENDLEELVIYTINILKDLREKGLIDEEEYLEHTKTKEDFLDFLREKRKQ